MNLEQNRDKGDRERTEGKREVGRTDKNVQYI